MNKKPLLPEALHIIQSCISRRCAGLKSFCPAGLKIVLPVFLLFLAISVCPGLAQADDAAATNPHPAAGDIVLPMPKGLSMAFRVVAVPSHSLLRSLETTMGTTGTSQDEDLSATESGYRARLSAPFSDRDIPDSWKKSLPEDATGSFFYYLIAKYEVTRLQYRAVMEDEAKELSRDRDDSLPVSNISWYDAMAFTARYTDWLIANHPDMLPGFYQDARNTGFVRLPTEAEWEYAAHGGQFESTNYRQQPFFHMDEGKSMSDYAVFGTTAPAPAGSKEPNPLGLYDTAGNVAEMTLDAFRFTSGGRLQGSAGGFVRKGGSFAEKEQELYPGSREEFALFTKKGSTKAADLGFRPVISGINTPEGDRMLRLEEEYNRMSGQTETKDTSNEAAASTPMGELNRLIRKTTDPVLLSHLVYLRSELAKSNIVQNQERANRACNQLQQCAMLLEVIRNINHKSYITEKMELRAINMGLETATTNAKKKEWQKKKKAKEQELAANNALLRETTDSYISEMKDISRLDSNDVAASFQVLEALYRGNDRYNTRMSRMLKLVRKHYDALAGSGTLSQDALLKELGAEK